MRTTGTVSPLVSASSVHSLGSSWFHSCSGTSAARHASRGGLRVRTRFSLSLVLPEPARRTLEDVSGEDDEARLRMVSSVALLPSLLSRLQRTSSSRQYRLALRERRARRARGRGRLAAGVLRGRARTGSTVWSHSDVFPSFPRRTVKISGCPAPAHRAFLDRYRLPFLGRARAKRSHNLARLRHSQLRRRQTVIKHRHKRM